MTKIISLFNNKGGVSKTTTTFHLGWKLAELGYKTLIVDTDPLCRIRHKLSTSTRRTFFPSRASPTPRLTELMVFEHPPF